MIVKRRKWQDNRIIVGRKSAVRHMNKDLCDMNKFKEKCRLGAVAQACNPSTLGCGGENHLSPGV